MGMLVPFHCRVFLVWVIGSSAHQSLLWCEETIQQFVLKYFRAFVEVFAPVYDVGVYFRLPCAMI